MPRNAQAAQPRREPNDEALPAGAEAQAPSPEDVEPEVAEKKKRRRLIIAIVTAVVVLGALVYYLYSR
ncbi:MAG TPA: hypothetical protein VLA14_10670, partial [Polyangia bacterium]|nr:hypothetical protein [Polyangia bacterium]